MKWYTQEKFWLSWVNLLTYTLHINEFIVLKYPLWGSASVIWQSYFLWLLLINILKMWACFLFLICKVGYTAMWKFNWCQFCLLPLTSPHIWPSSSFAWLYLFTLFMNHKWNTPENCLLCRTAWEATDFCATAGTNYPDNIFIMKTTDGSNKGWDSF